MNAQISAETWDGLRAACPNVLLVGAEISRQDNLAALLEASRPPVWWCDGAQFTLPSETVGTLVLQSPAALPAEEQRALLDWAARNLRVQIITVTPSPLYPLVQAGTFLDDLYYWLNVVTIPD
jgi:hypothetical protein